MLISKIQLLCGAIYTCVIWGRGSANPLFVQAAMSGLKGRALPEGPVINASVVLDKERL